MTDELDAVVVNARFDGLNNLLANVPALVRAVRSEAKRNKMKAQGRVLVQVTAEVRPREEGNGA